MEGPTPVSALIHAATMVTAGVYLILRTAAIVEYTPVAISILLIIGSLTALYGSLTACWQNDIKKIIAYSTCSQLGYMFVACGLSIYTTSIYHLFNHAFFKAGLFLASGIIIHSLSEEQDIRRLGSLRGKLPIVYVMFLIGSLSLSGFSFTSGFYSKDLILSISGTEGVLLKGSFVFLILNIAAAFSALYSLRLIKYTFFSDIRYFKASARNYHPTNKFTYNILIVLSLLSIVSGYVFERLFRPGSLMFNDVFLSDRLVTHSIELEFIPLWIRVIPLYILIVILIIIQCYSWASTEYGNYVNFIRIQKFFIGRGYFDVVYNKYLVVGI